MAGAGLATLGIRIAFAEGMSLPHHSLVAWQRADDLFITLHGVSLTFPPIERFELASQLRRSAFSVPANIAEGSSRRTKADKLHFYQMALSSLAEAGYCIHAGRRLGYLGPKDYDMLELSIRQASAPLRGLMKTLGRERP